ncbi:MAG: phage holin family protein [Clostridia bacterium]|nr:phage holin family protein [Clostridia bacterium]
MTKTIPALMLAPIFAYFGALGFPMILLLAVIICDYISGLTAAWTTRSLSSRVGILGIVKKVCYLLLVAVGVVIDLMLQSGLSDVLPSLFGDGCHPIALLVIVWLVVNECLSILENLTEIGIPMPGFLARIVAKLKKTLENGTEDTKEDLDDRSGE